MHMLLYAFLVDILYVRTVLGLDVERRFQVDLIEGLHLANTSFEGLVAAIGVHSFSPAILLQGETRHVQLPQSVFYRITQLLAEGRDFTFLATLQQEQHNAGTILAFSEGNDRFLELQSSGRKDEIRLHYSHQSTVRMETFPYRLADGRWHRLALTVSGNHASLMVDCNRIYERVIRDVDHNFTGRNLSLWLGQRNAKHFLFKGSMQDVKIVAKEHGYILQCPHLDTECPTCGQFRQLQSSVSNLESHIRDLTMRLADAERRIAVVEQCDCRRSCNINGSIHADGATWRQDCDICTCMKGEIQCYPVRCPVSPCKNPVLTPGECCPTCLKQCMLHGVLYDHGEELSFRQCIDCACHDGSMKCVKMDPLTACPPLACAEDEQFSVPGECCRFCPGVDYCAKGHSCHGNATCINLRTRFACQCNAGFHGDGKQCEDIDECARRGGHDGHYCHSNTQCVNTVGSYTCECMPGYVRVDAFNCAEHDECSTGEHTCHTNAMCINTEGGYRCHCLPGYAGDGFSCEPICNRSCVHGGRCVAPGTCACRRGYVGPSCDVDVDECSLGIHQCHQSSTCINMPGWYRCECKAGYHSLNQEDDGLGLFCQDVDECALGIHTCDASAKCMNTEGSFECHCEAIVNCSADCHLGSENKQNGSTWHPDDDPCSVCSCSNGVISCEKSKCNCTDGAVEMHCCPQCDRSSTCSHQELSTPMQNGDRWLYQCQICECLYGEVDCWEMECPPASCDSPVLSAGDCCPRCNDDPCATLEAQMGANDSLSAVERGCTYSGQKYGSRKHWNALHDPCTTCQCKDGHICCSYNSDCDSVGHELETSELTAKNEDETSTVDDISGHDNGSDNTTMMSPFLVP